MPRIKKSFIVVALLAILITASVAITQRNKFTFRTRIVTATDRIVKDEGECALDLNILFADLEWDTVSIFVAGNSKQIQDSLLVDNDISDGIVFSDNGKSVMLEMSTYDFLNDELPLVSFYVERTQPDDPYYVSKSRDQAVLHVKKFISYNGTYKYLVYFI